jgi:DNA-binding SARP family transcriptional activator
MSGASMAADQSRGATLEMLGRWRLTARGHVLSVPGRDQRLIAAVALLSPRPRRQLAELLWPKGTSDSARANLRVNLWDIRHRFPGVFAAGGDSLTLSPSVTVDVVALRLMQTKIDTCDCSQLWTILEMTRRAELLPGWSEPWLDFEQEQMRLQRVRTLETLSRRFRRLRDADGAVAAATLAIYAEPWRETSYRLLMKAHMLAGNRALALRVYEEARVTLLHDLQVEPAPILASLAAELRHSSQA